MLNPKETKETAKLFFFKEDEKKKCAPSHSTAALLLRREALRAHSATLCDRRSPREGIDVSLLCYILERCVAIGVGVECACPLPPERKIPFDVVNFFSLSR